MATSRNSGRSGRPRTFPVTVQKLPVVRCDLCQEMLAHPPGKAGDTLTRHYEQRHPSALPGR